MQELALAKDHIEHGNLDTAYNIADKWLTDNPEDPVALIVMVASLLRAKKLTVAYHLAEKLTQLAPLSSASWVNYGMVCNELWRSSDSERAYRQGLKICKDPKARILLNCNLAALMIDQSRFSDALIYLKDALKIEPNHEKTLSNIGFVQLARREWDPGWKNYALCVGTDWRKKVQYGEEPQWDGLPGQCVAIYGEQGIGDEICFASMVPDAIRDCRKVILDVDARNVGLFMRSFPQAVVYGTKGRDELNWAPEDQAIDASLPMGQLGQFYRLTDGAFPTEPYLVPDPERVLMWRSLFATKGKPVIGIAWTGGIQRTGAKFRHCRMEDWEPLFSTVDAHYVSLQYQRAGDEIKGYPVTEYPHATLTKDYDDTAALVAACDVVVGVPTAVIHLAGAIGTPVIAMKAQYYCWKYAAGLPFHPVHKIVQNEGSWRATVAASIPYVEEVCASSSVTTPVNHSLTTSCSTLSPPTPVRRSA